MSNRGFGRPLFLHVRPGLGSLSMETTVYLGTLERVRGVCNIHV